MLSVKLHQHINENIVVLGGKKNQKWTNQTKRYPMIIFPKEWMLYQCWTLKTRALGLYAKNFIYKFSKNVTSEIL